MIFLDPKTDIAFKKLFGVAEHKNIIINFLNNVLGRAEGEKIVDVIFNDPFNLPETVELKRSIVDVRVTDQQGKNYIIEMQVLNQDDFKERCQFYSAAALARQLPKGGKYSLLMPVIFIGVVNFNLLQTKNYVSHHFIIDQETGHQSLTLQEFHFIELQKFNKAIDAIKNVLDKWIYLMKNANTMDKVPPTFQEPEAIQEAFQVLNKLNWTVKELEAYDRERDALWSEQSRLDTAIKEGVKEGKIEIAKNLLLKTKMSITEIAELTGLTLEEIEKLKDQ